MPSSRLLVLSLRTTLPTTPVWPTVSHIGTDILAADEPAPGGPPGRPLRRGGRGGSGPGPAPRLRRVRAAATPRADVHHPGRAARLRGPLRPRRGGRQRPRLAPGGRPGGDDHRPLRGEPLRGAGPGPPAPPGRPLGGRRRLPLHRGAELPHGRRLRHPPGLGHRRLLRLQHGQHGPGRLDGRDRRRPLGVSGRRRRGGRAGPAGPPPGDALPAPAGDGQGRSTGAAHRRRRGHHSGRAWTWNSYAGLLARTDVLFLGALRYFPTVAWGAASLTFPLLVFRVSQSNTAVGLYTMVSLVAASGAQLLTGRQIDRLGRGERTGARRLVVPLSGAILLCAALAALERGEPARALLRRDAVGDERLGPLHHHAPPDPRAGRRTGTTGAWWPSPTSCGAPGCSPAPSAPASSSTATPRPPSTSPCSASPITLFAALRFVRLPLSPVAPVLERSIPDAAG